MSLELLEAALQQFLIELVPPPVLLALFVIPLIWLFFFGRRHRGAPSPPLR
jgi:hypothetical protein